MPKRPDTIQTVLLALELLKRIPRSRAVTASELHEQLLSAGIERELRTVQRQLDMLCQHFDIERDESEKPYRYRWKERAKGLALPVLSEQESLLLILAEQQLHNLLPSSVMQSMKGFFEQARSNLDSADDPTLAQEWLSKVRVVSQTQPLLPPTLQPGIFAAVSTALYRNLWLEVDYSDWEGKKSHKRIMPLGLAQQGPNLYLVFRYSDTAEDRTLALHRMKSAAVSTMTFERPKDFDLENYDRDGRFGFGEGKRVKLSFRIKKARGLFLYETRLSEDQVIQEMDGWLRVTATVVDSGFLDWWLNGFGKFVQGIRKRRKTTAVAQR